MKLFDTLRGLPTRVIFEPRSRRPGGLISTLTHMFVVDQIWCANLVGRPHGFKARNLDVTPPFDELEGAQRTLDHWYVHYSDAQSQNSLDQVVSFTFVDGQPGALRRGDILLHIANHKTYDRGYVADMLYESGFKPPPVDLPVFLRDAWPCPQVGS
jgi:uncharacterized damage-inducible protein DinB